ncbi:uncharacterized protein LOC105209560 isoform X2 [Zeugodacus cucurbitae]|uniref:uncharacterized protein LOC105209560 isoform X2 n=1 Tax=Zeugodacus cucurbitae TaxID=28588 RepID=UPI0023D95EAD|nr:uncharacterized protein LOC105209560 isoform X2 [Zeugodacus cucurbitae]
MCTNTDKRLWWRCHHTSNAVLLLLLLLLKPTFIQTMRETVDEHNFDYLKFNRNQNQNYANSSNLPDSQVKSSEGSGVVHYFRFHDFEPRALSTYTWTAATKSPMVEAERKSINSEESALSVISSKLSEKRKPRGIHFEADGKDLSINLEFIIPFLRVPIARSVEITQSAFRKLADLNSDTLLISSGVAIVGAIIAAVVKSVVTPTLFGYAYKKASRAADTMDGFNFGSYAPATDKADLVTNSSQDVLNLVEDNLHANHINVSVCAQRAICNYVQQATSGVRTGLGSPTDRIVDGLISLDLLKHYLNGTALKHAIDMGRSRDATGCELIYRECEWPKMQNKAWEIAKKLLIGYLGRQQL